MIVTCSCVIYISFCSPSFHLFVYLCLSILSFVDFDFRGLATIYVAGWEAIIMLGEYLDDAYNSWLADALSCCTPAFEPDAVDSERRGEFRLYLFHTLF